GRSVMGVLSTTGTSADALVSKARAAAGMDGMDLASAASTTKAFDWTEGTPRVLPEDLPPPPAPKHRVTVVDFGVKRGILRQLVDAGCAVHVVPHNTTAETILQGKPDGIL